MSLNFNFQVSMDAAIFLIRLAELTKKYNKIKVDYPNRNSDASKAFTAVKKTRNFIMQSKQLSRQGLIAHDRDEDGLVLSWYVTPKGFAMCELLKYELQEVAVNMKLIEDRKFNKGLL